MERTIALIKSHLWEDFSETISDVIIEILGKYLNNGLQIVAIGKFDMTKQTAQRFYDVHRVEPFFNNLVKTMVGPTIGILLEGENAIQKVRELNGATDPREASEGTLRAEFGRKEKGPYNAVHGSDSIKSAVGESFIIFGYID